MPEIFALLQYFNRNFSTAAENAPAGSEAAEVVEVQASLRVASVWYTHSGPLLRELQSCVAEFQQYLANLARSIRAAAADMAIGLVHPRSVRDPFYYFLGDVVIENIKRTTGFCTEVNRFTRIRAYLNRRKAYRRGDAQRASATRSMNPTETLDRSF